MTAAVLDQPNAENNALLPLPHRIEELPQAYDLMVELGIEVMSRDYRELHDLQVRMIQYTPGALLVFRYEDARRLGMNPKLHTTPISRFMEMGFFAMSELPVPVESLPNVRKFQSFSLMTLEPDAHATVKRIVFQHLMPKEMPPYRQIGAEIAEALLERLGGAGTVNLVEDFGRAMALRFIGELYGLTEQEQQGALRGIQGMRPLFQADLSEDALRHYEKEAIPTYWDNFGPAILRARESGKFEHLDRIEALIKASPELPEEVKAHFELVIATNLVDMFHVIATAISVSVLEILRNPEAADEVRRDPSLATKAVGEALRLHSPVPGIARFAREDLDYDGLHIPAGTSLMMYWAPANRDPSVFAEPNRFDLHRSDKGQAMPLTFGIGAQLCPGRNIGQTLAVAAVNALVRKDVSIELVDEPSWLPAGSAPPYTPIAIPVRMQRT